MKNHSWWKFRRIAKDPIPKYSSETQKSCYLATFLIYVSKTQWERPSDRFNFNLRDILANPPLFHAQNRRQCDVNVPSQCSLSFRFHGFIDRGRAITNQEPATRNSPVEINLSFPLDYAWRTEPAVAYRRTTRERETEREEGDLTS